VAKYRAEAKKKKKAKKHEKEKKRKLAKAQSERSEDAVGGDSGDDKPLSANTGRQFGSNGNKSKKDQVSVLTRASRLCPRAGGGRAQR
jgi:hypothetical protein